MTPEQAAELITSLQDINTTIKAATCFLLLMLFTITFAIGSIRR